MITETETAFLAVIRAFLTEEKASPAEIQGLTEKQWNHLFVLAAQHSLLSAVYDVVGKTPEFAGLPDELRRQVKTQAMQSVLQQVSRTALFLSDEKELAQLQKEIPLYREYIEKLSGYIRSSGKRYQDHAATIHSWYTQDHPAPVRRSYECKEDESL